MRISVDKHKGEVLITFDQAYTWLSLPPDMAREIAGHIKKAADDLVPPKCEHKSRSQHLKNTDTEYWSCDSCGQLTGAFGALDP